MQDETTVQAVQEGDVVTSPSDVAVQDAAQVELEQVKGERDQLLDRLARLQAEFDNARKREVKERQDARDLILRGRAARLKPPSRRNRAEAIEFFQRALALDGQSVDAQSWLAIALTARALDVMAEAATVDIAYAEELADRALAGSPRRALVRFAKAQVLRAQQRYAEAVLEYETTIALNPNWAHAYSHLGWCKAMTGSIEALIPAQERAIRLSPRDPKSACSTAGSGARICCRRASTRRSSGAKGRATPLWRTHSSARS